MKIHGFILVDLVIFLCNLQFYLLCLISCFVLSTSARNFLHLQYICWPDWYIFVIICNNTFIKQFLCRPLSEYTHSPQWDVVQSVISTQVNFSRDTYTICKSLEMCQQYIKPSVGCNFCVQTRPLSHGYLRLIVHMFNFAVPGIYSLFHLNFYVVHMCAHWRNLCSSINFLQLCVQLFGTKCLKLVSLVCVLH